MTSSFRTAGCLEGMVIFVMCWSFVMAFAETPSPQERMVDLGGYRLHVITSGSGTPTVVFENGMGEDLSTWSKVDPAIAKVTRTFLYDRAGLGKSDSSPHGKDPKQIAHDLHVLLRAANVQPPYILVGHSLGGAVVQVFAGEYPEEIAGLVLVDPEDGRLVEQLRSRFSASAWAERQKAVAEAVSQMTPAIRKESAAMDVSGKQTAKAVIPSVPIVVLTGTLKNPDFPGNPLEQDLKAELHHQFIAAHSQTEQVLVPESRHYIQDDAPEKVIAAIRRVIDKAQARRSGGCR